MKRFFLFAAFAAAALVSCNKAEEPVRTSEPQAVRFTVQNLGSYALKSTAAIGESGTSTVGIYAADLSANNVEATVSAGTLVPSTTIYWGVGQTTNSTFIARYPYAEGAGVSDSYDIPADQSSLDTYSYQENFVTAVQSANPNPGTVAFNFKHPFAKIVISVVNNLGADVATSVVMQNMKMNATALDLSTAPATPTVANTKSNVTAYKLNDTTFEMIVLPQDATNEMNIVVTTLMGSEYTFRITNDSYSFAAEKVATATVTLDPTDGSASSRTAVGALSFTTTDWSDGDATTVGTVGTPTVGNYWTITGCVYTTADKDSKPAAWGKAYNMVYTAENTWSITINYDPVMSSDSGVGFKFKKGDTYYGADSAETVATGTVLSSPGASNIHLGSAGKYEISFNTSTHKIAYEYKSDAE